MKNVLVLQSGGPTAAINATLAGVVERAFLSHRVDKVYGSRYGIVGVLEDNIVDIGTTLSSPQEMKRLIQTPGAALGSCRKRLPPVVLKDPEYQCIFQRLKEYNIGYVIAIGGNDSMDTVVKLSQYAQLAGIKDVFVMGAPKTVDNDLYGMDHSPGFPSAARYVATTFMELWADCNVYHTPAVTIVEIMGRHVGWLAASSVLASRHGGAPSLIYLPERPFSNEQFITDIKKQQEIKGPVVVAVSEGIRYSGGQLVAEELLLGDADDFGHRIVSGVGKKLEGLVDREIGCKVRSIELSLMQRSAGHISSSVDIYESRMLGQLSMNKALKGFTGEVSVLNRLSSEPYRVAYSTIDAQQVANLEKTIPDSWINKEGNFVTQEMVDYLNPLVRHEGESRYVDGLPKHLSFL